MAFRWSGVRTPSAPPSANSTFDCANRCAVFHFLSFVGGLRVEWNNFGRWEFEGRRGRGAYSPVRVLQCYTAWPACTKWRFRVLHRVLQNATGVLHFAGGG